MDIYLVVGKLDGFNYNYDEFTHSSFTKEETALNHAVDLANGDVSIGGTDEVYLLHSIIKVNSDSKKVTEYELILEKGRFLLSKLKNS